MKLTHFNQFGRARIVNVSEKEKTARKAIAKGTIKMHSETLAKIIDGHMKKGDVLSVSQVAGIMGAKKTSELIPMCHNILIDGIDIDFEINKEKNEIDIFASVNTVGKTGVEMEALTAVSVTALTIYDMCKAIDKDMVIKDICLLEKIGGKSGHYLKKDVKINEG